MMMKPKSREYMKHSEDGAAVTSTHITTATRLTLALLMASVLSACGGGGGGSSASDGPAPPPPVGNPIPAPPAVISAPAGSTLDTPTYAADSAELAIFVRINEFRAACGFQPYKQNAILDQSQKKHADYIFANDRIIVDYEVPGKPGFAGVTPLDRAIPFGWPQELWVGGGNAGIYTVPARSDYTYGVNIADAWATGVYHQPIIATPADLAGIALVRTEWQGYPQLMGGIALSLSRSDAAKTGDPAAMPLTFPCQGLSNVPYLGAAETPTPPNTGTSAWGTPQWGTPVTVVGNLTDLINITSASISDSTTTVTMNIINSANDVTTLTPPYEAVAYPKEPLQPNTQYQVNLAGTINGRAFTRSFTFTTGAPIN
jgi:hypothetical protein